MISLKNTLEAIKTKLSAHDKALSVDYIVEQGTSGIWTYRKWNSGIAECWGNSGDYGNVSISSAWGSIYDSETDVGSIAYPSNLFLSTPTFLVTGQNAPIISVETGGGSSTQTPRLYLVRPAQGTAVNPILSLYARGKWK